jgi:Zn-dependent metalloprotease
MRKSPQVLFVYFLMIALGMVLIRPESASAQAGDGIKRQYNPETGRVNFISSISGRPLPASQVLGFTPDNTTDPALAIAQRFGPEFGLKDAVHELTAVRSVQAGNGRLIVRYQQAYKSIPVMAGELVVNTNLKGDLYSMNGEVALDLSVPIHPTIDSEEASRIALQAAAKWYRMTPGDLIASTPTLWIFDETLLRPSQRPAELVWRMELTSFAPFVPVRELVLVNAQNGSISLHFNQIDTGAKKVGTPGLSLSTGTLNAFGLNDRESVSLPSVSPIGGYRQTYTAKHGTSLPGQLLCDQTISPCTNGNNIDANLAHEYAAETWSFYDDHHNRDSIDNQGMTIISTVQYSSNYLNAFWDGTQMVYGDGMVADDIVGHELTHGVTQNESNLFYYYQSGAINESFSDLWGELIDQSNTSGNDAAGVKWQIGEDSPVGAFRSMSDPTIFGDPDSIASPNYDTDPFFQDNGGVHRNSGVNNKAAYLMVEGGTFGNKTVTALGVNKTLAVYYEAQTNLLTSGADYADLYNALHQACLNLVGGSQGITNANCQEVRDATDAVNMNTQPNSDSNYNTDAPYCDSDETPQDLFYDDMESGITNWIFGSPVGTTRWQIDSPEGPYAHSGQHALYAYDLPATVTDTYARLKSAVSIPSGAFLHFNQAFGFEDYFFLGSFDGGVLEYSTNGGASWVDAGSLFAINGYNGTIDSGYDNPLGGRLAFVGDSHGYISSRVSLSSLANQEVIFRWRMGLDTGGNDFGWWLDDVRIYTCNGFPLPTHPPVVSSIVRAGSSPTNAASVNFTVARGDGRV